MERSIDFTVTSIENNIFSNYIAAIEEIEEHEVILYSSADEAIENLEADAYHSSELAFEKDKAYSHFLADQTIENYKNDGREATKNICAGPDGEMVELSSNIHMGETLFKNVNNDNNELEARTHSSLEQLIEIKGLKTKKNILPELKIYTFDKTRQ